MPIVHVEWIKGRTEEQRNLVAEKITEAIVEIGNAKPEAVTIIFEEVDSDKLYKAGVQHNKIK